MTRTVNFLLAGWTAFFLPIIACSRNSVKTNFVSTDTTFTQSVDSSGSPHNYLALGDSYTIGTSIPEAGAYPYQTIAELQKAGLRFSGPEIIASNGWTTTNLLAALADKDPAEHYDIVTLLIGVNNQYQGGSIDNYRDQFGQLLEQSIALAGNRPDHVIVLSIPDYSVTPFGKGREQGATAAQIDAFNAANKEIALNHGAQYLYITDDTRSAGSNSALLAGDSLHYSASEYAIWAKALAPLFRSVLND